MTVATMESLFARENPFTPSPDLRIFIDGELLPPSEARISVFDHGLLYGDGVFEGIRVYNGRIFREQEHIVRIFESAKAIRLEIPMTAEQLGDAMYRTLEANNLRGKDAYIRLLVTRGVGLLGISIRRAACPSVIIIADKIALYPAEVYHRGLRCVVSSIMRNHHNALSPRVKSLNYLNNVLAKAEAHDAGADEAIMLNVFGRVSECTGDNIFVYKHGALVTPPPSEGILEGVTRQVVIELARKRGIPVREDLLLRHDLYVAEECFATGTAAEIVPIVEIDKRPVGDGKPGPVTKQLTEDFIACRTRA